MDDNRPLLLLNNCLQSTDVILFRSFDGTLTCLNRYFIMYIERRNRESAAIKWIEPHL